MRLIDADKLCDELKEVSKLKGTTDKGRERARYVAEFIDFLGNASTIEAIPIEWLKEFAADYVRTSDKDSKVWIFCLVEAIGRWREEQGNEDQGSC